MKKRSKPIDRVLGRIVADMDQMTAISNAAVRWMRTTDDDDEFYAAARLTNRALDDRALLAFQYVGANEEACGR